MTDNISEIVVASLVQSCQGVLVFFSRILRALTRAFITDGHFEFCEKRTVPYFCSHFSRSHCSWARRWGTRPLYNGWRGPARNSSQRIPDHHDLWPYHQIIARCSTSKRKFFVSSTTVHSMCLRRWFRSDCTLLPNIHADPTGPWWNEYHQKSEQVRRCLDLSWRLLVSFDRVSWQSLWRSAEESWNLRETWSNSWLTAIYICIYIYMRYPY